MSQSVRFNGSQTHISSRGPSGPLVSSGSSGFSLIELVLVVGMMGFIITAFATFAAHMSRDLRGSNQKIEQMTMGQDLQMGLRMDNAACSLTLGTNSTFNANQITQNSGPRINLPQGIVINSNTGERIAQPGELLRGTAAGLRVQRTELEIIREVPNANPGVLIYEGVFRITLDPNSLVRSLQPVSVPYFFDVDPASPPGSRLITGCAPQPVGQPCPAGQVQTGILANGDSICITTAELLGGANLSCPEGTYMAGFTAQGNPDCQPLPEIPPDPEPGGGGSGGNAVYSPVINLTAASGAGNIQQIDLGSVNDFAFCSVARSRFISSSNHVMEFDCDVRRSGGQWILYARNWSPSGGGHGMSCQAICLPK